MEKADLGNCESFIHKLLSEPKTIINEIYGENIPTNFDQDELVRKLIDNCLLQCVLIIGHLQSSSLEFFHADYKPDNVFIKKLSSKQVKYFTYKINKQNIKLENMGFAALIADFDRSSISLERTISTLPKFRFIPPILFKPLLKTYIDNMIKKYGDIDPNDMPNIKFDKYFINNITPNFANPMMTILRSSGITLYRDIDLYTFFIKLLESKKVYYYFVDSNIANTILKFMSNKFLENLFNIPVKNRSISESAYIAIKIFDHINEPMTRIFTDDYIEILQQTCENN